MLQRTKNKIYISRNKETVLKTRYFIEYRYVGMRLNSILYRRGENNENSINYGI
jgi:hypothetical protein